MESAKSMKTNKTLNVCVYWAGRRHPPQEEAVGGGVPVTPEEQNQANQTLTQQVMNQQEQEATPRSERTETFEISQDPETHSDENRDDDDEAAHEAALNAARVQADQVVIHGIRQAEVNNSHTIFS